MSIGRTRTGLALRIVSYEVDASWLERIQKAIEKEIARGARRRRGSADALEEPYRSLIEDEESEETEELLGIAFVACQSYMSRIWTQLEAFNRTCSDEFGKRVSALENFQQVLKIAKVKVARSRLTQAEAIFAVGNYWKYSDQWPVRDQGIVRKNSKRWVRRVWDGKRIRKDRRSKFSYDAVYVLGMRYGNTGNLRHVARRLGVKEYDNLGPIREALSRWRDALLLTANQEIEKLVEAQQKAGAATKSQQ